MQHLQEFTEWESFLEELEEVKARVDLSSVAKCESLKTRHDIPSHMIDKTYVQLLNHCHVFGSERYAAHLRLLCAIHAVDHFEHYLTTVNLL